MRGVNRVTLVGNLGQEPELKYTQGNHAILRLRIATNERLPAKGGETRDHTEWHTVTCWGKRAERLAKELRKGSGVYVEGRLTTRSWEDRDGNKRYATEVSSDVVVALAREAANGPDGDERPSRGRQGSLPGAGEDASPFDSEPGQGDDDIPFDRAPTAEAQAVGAHPSVTRFWARVAKTDRCWEWTGPTYQATGYGQTTAQRAAVIASSEPAPAVARRLGVDEKTVRAIRRRNSRAA